MYEENFIPLRDLEPGDRFLTKGNSELIYLYPLGDDKHRISRLNGDSWDVPHGDFPSFKYKGNE
jgi:hypothetical protein